MPLIGRKKLNTAIDTLVDNQSKKLRGVFFQGLGQVVQETPVDSGRARGNWFLSVGAPSSSVTTSTNSSASFRQLDRMPKDVLGKKIFFSNNLPYIGVLEYGGYPSPVERGTFNKRTGRFEIRSLSGFSKQAPKGWVRTAIIRMQNKVRKI